MAESIDELIGQRGTIVGDHPWAGHHGTIVRGELTIVGYGVVVKLDDSHDSPHGDECFVFSGKLWRPDKPKGGPRIGKLVIKDWPEVRRG